MDKYTVYVLQNKQRRLYIGQTGNLISRLDAHARGLSFFTKGKGPWWLVYQEQYDTRAQAMAREKVLKTGRGRDFIKQIISARTRG